MKTTRVMTATLLALALTAARASATDLWLHVKVHDGKEDSHVTINLPMSMVEKASALMPAEARSAGKIQLDGKEMSVAQLRQIWDEVQKRPDATYVTVDDKSSKVRISRSGEYLHIISNGHGDKKGGHENVDMKIPISVVSALLSGSGDQLNIAAAIQELGRRGEGELVTVNGDDETVRIWVDAAAESR